MKGHTTMKKLLLTVCIALGVAALALPLSAYYQDMGGKKDDKAGGAPQMSEEDMKHMANMKKNGTPGMHHDHLKPLVGNWTCDGKCKMAPEQPWQPMKSTATSKWVLGNRFVATEVKGEAFMPGEPPFEGMGWLGYDNLKKKYVMSWIDNMGTMIMNGEGTCDNSGKTITIMSNFVCPAMEKETHMKMVYKIQGNDKYSLEFWGPDPKTGKEFMSMEMNYTKK